MLARICPEKGVHLAIEAAKRAGVPLLIAGETFPYGEHQRYFREEVEPRLDRWRRFIGPVGMRRKRRLLAAARCVLVPSLVPETSSLVAREALASGTPVIAFARGALTETVEHGRTGFLVHDHVTMADAIQRTMEIDPEQCRAVARARFSLDGMIRQYFALYEAFAGGRQARAVTVGAA
jgi:glycosyltransferase involved in cell wall biosynthesis